MAPEPALPRGHLSSGIVSPVPDGWEGRSTALGAVGAFPHHGIHQHPTRCPGADLTLPLSSNPILVLSLFGVALPPIPEVASSLLPVRLSFWLARKQLWV